MVEVATFRRVEDHYFRRVSFAEHTIPVDARSVLVIAATVGANGRDLPSVMSERFDSASERSLGA